MPYKIEVKCLICGQKFIGYQSALRWKLKDHLAEKHPKQAEISRKQEEDYYKDVDKISKKYNKKSPMSWFNYHDVLIEAGRRGRGD